MATDADIRDDDGLIPADQIVADIQGLEGDIRDRQQAISTADNRWKRSGRTDLMPGRHYAIALTALEEARLRVQEAARLEAALDTREP